MSAAELSQAAGGAVVFVLWGLLLIAAFTLVGVTVYVVMLRRRLSRAASAIERHRRSTQELRDRERALIDAVGGGTGYADILDGVDRLKAEVRRLDGIRTKTERRLRDQNAELEVYRAHAGNKT